MVVTIPSPTLARIVSSPAPPTRRSIFARTVTRERALSWIPSFAMAATSGVSMTLGLTDIWTASRTSLPARSIATLLLKVSSIFALSAAINACTTRLTFPPARKWDSRLSVEISIPALTAIILDSTISLGGTFLNLIKIILIRPDTRA